ncbi:transporter [Siculibacillus lacustris]|uniref:Transporter n=1 Tax=Siculibacillus lacustris TaxID=1549641 RepID=A0A4Q9VVM0_9HYPH|nr:TOBE domain-containing protein [Siculibacillus lacustris]TBW40316.1 transporter [Siculibacillus lacustris]
MRFSARNILSGTILKVTRGATTAHVVVEVAPGRILTASITTEAVDDLDLRVGMAVAAVIKASDVMIAID